MIKIVFVIFMILVPILLLNSTIILIKLEE